MCFCLSLQVTAQEACEKPSVPLVLGWTSAKPRRASQGPAPGRGGRGSPTGHRLKGRGDNEGGFWEETRGQPPPRGMFTHPEPGAGLPLVYTSLPVRGRTHPPRPNHTVKTESLTFFFPPPRLRMGDGLCLQLAQVLGAGAGAGRAARGGCVFQGPGPREPSRIWSGDAPGETPQEEHFSPEDRVPSRPGQGLVQNSRNR